MATYVVGDIQGCYTEFRQLLDLINPDFVRDRLWLVGDMVNRGPASLQVLRFVRSLPDESVIALLGNHDLHLLMVAAGCSRLHPDDTLDGILHASDRDELLDWLRHRPMLHANSGYVMVHAGLLPSWSSRQAALLAQEVEAALRGPDVQQFYSCLYGNQPDSWTDALSGHERLRVIVNAMTRMRVCTADGKMEFSYKGSVRDAPPGFLPWFDVPGRASQNVTVICGHWSALGLHLRDHLVALDTGCLWGGYLTAIRLEDRKIFQIPSVRGAAGKAL